MHVLHLLSFINMHVYIYTHTYEVLFIGYLVNKNLWSVILKCDSNGRNLNNKSTSTSGDRSFCDQLVTKRASCVVFFEKTERKVKEEGEREGDLEG